MNWDELLNEGDIGAAVVQRIDVEYPYDREHR